MSATRITNNQIATSTITAQNIQSGTLVGSLFNQNLTLNSNVTISGNLNVMGNTATINATNTYINDPLVVFNNGYTGSLTGYDIGIVVNRNLASLAPYGSVNTFLGWVESDQAFEALATTSTGGNVQSINNSGFANVKVGNVTSVSETITGTLAVTGATTFTTALGSSLQVAAIGNVTPGTAVFTTATTGGLQAVAIGNVTPGTAVFTTGTFNTATTGGLQAVAIGNVTPGTATFTTATTGGLQAVAIGNATPGSGAFTTGTFSSTLGVTGATTMTTATTGGLQAVAIGNVTPGTGAFTTGTFNTATTGGLQATAIGNVTAGLGYFTTATATTVNAATIGNTGATFSGATGTFTTSVTTPTVTATTVNAATIGNASAALSGATGTFTGTVIASTVNAATIGNTGATFSGATGTFTTSVTTPTVTATTVNAATIGNASAALSGATGTFTGTVIASTVNAATIGNASAALSGASLSLNGTDNNGIAYTSGALQIVGGAGISGNLYVQGNVYAGNLISTTTQILEVTDPLVYLNASTPSNYNYEIGFYSHFGPYSGVSYQHTGLTRDHNDNVWKLFSNVAAEPSNGTVSFTNAIYDTLKLGNIVLANTQNATSTTTGVLQVGGGVGVAQSVWAGGYYTTGSAYLPTIYSTNVNAATIGNTGAILTGATLNTSGTATVNSLTSNGAVLGTTATFNTVNAATIGNIGATLTGATLNTSGTATVNSLTSNGAVLGTTATFNTVNAATIGNIGATLIGTLSASNIAGTVSTANSATYATQASTVAINAATTSSVYYPIFVPSNTTTAQYEYVDGNNYLQYNPGTGNLATKVLTATSNVFIGTPLNYTPANAPVQVGYSINNYSQFSIQNANNGNNASTDIAAVANNGSDNDTYVDMGIVSSTYNQAAYSLYKPNDGYLIVSGNTTTGGGNLILNTYQANDIVFATGGTTAKFEVARITSGNTVVVKSTNNNTLSANTGAFQLWGGASISGNAYIGGSSYQMGGALFNHNQASAGTSGSANQNAFIMQGVNDSTLIYAKPLTAYDAVIIGGNAASASFAQGAKFIVNSTDSMILPVGTSAQRPGSSGGTDTTGMLRYSSTVGSIEWYNGTTWGSASTSFTVIADQQFTGTGSQTAFTLSSSQTTASCIVSINGVVQIPTLAYSVSGTTLTFTEAPLTTDVIDVRMLTTTSTVAQLYDTSGYNTVNTITGTGVTITTGTSALTTQYTFDTNGGFVTNGSNVTIASAGTSVIDNLFANSYSSAKYTITATIQGTTIREVTEVLMVHTGNGAGAGSVYMSSYGRVNTAGNTLVTYSGATSGNIAQLQATTTNANTILRIKRDYMAI